MADLSTMYLSFRFRTNWAYDKNRFVYANSINETAENKNVGVISVSSSIFIMSTVYSRSLSLRGVHEVNDVATLSKSAFGHSTLRFPLLAIHYSLIKIFLRVSVRLACGCVR
jgi:hypothetical protein